jgi:hypothetical protein
MSMIPDYILRDACISSKKFTEIVKDLDVIKMADLPPIDFSPLTDGERQEVIEWTFIDIPTPKIIQEFIDKCKKT